MLSLGLGLVLGVALGLLSSPMPGGGMFALGPAAGPPLVGMVLGALHRTGPVVRALSGGANRAFRQLGVLLFLAGLGLTAGPELAQLLASPTAWRAAVLSAMVTVVDGGPRNDVAGATACHAGSTSVGGADDGLAFLGAHRGGLLVEARGALRQRLGAVPGVLRRDRQVDGATLDRRRVDRGDLLRVAAGLAGIRWAGRPRPRPTTAARSGRARPGR